MNPFRQPSMRKTYDALIECYRIKHRDVIRANGTRNMGNAWSVDFWRGYDNSRPEQWDRESRKMLAYACWRAGRDTARAEQRSAA